MFDKMKELMEMKKQADQLKRELSAATVEVSDIQGIKVVVSGTQEFQSLTIEGSLIDPAKKEHLENDLLRSLNAAIKKSQNLAAQKMKNMLPGFPG